MAQTRVVEQAPNAAVHRPTNPTWPAQPNHSIETHHCSLDHSVLAWGTIDAEASVPKPPTLSVQPVLVGRRCRLEART